MKVLFSYNQLSTHTPWIN